MYAIIAYDISIERLNEVRKYLKRYLNWTQNSLFEGELTNAEIEEIKIKIKDLVDIDKDHIVIYITRSLDLIDRKSIGKPKLDASNIEID